jgi:hypothetical protein
MRKLVGHDQYGHLNGTAGLDGITINNHKSNSKFDSEIRVAQNVIGVIRDFMKLQLKLQ